MRGNSLVPVGRVDPRPAALDRLGRRAVDGAEPRVVMPVQQRGRRRHQLGADIVEDLPGPAQVEHLGFGVRVLGPSSAARIAHTCLPSARRPRKTAFSGGLSPSLAALPSTAWPPEISTWLRRSTRNSKGVGPSGHRAASTSVRSSVGAVRADAGQQRHVAQLKPCLVRSSLGFRAADVQQPVTELKGVDLGGVDAHQLAAANDAQHDVGQVPRRTAGFLRADFAFGEREPGVGCQRRSSIISTTLGVCRRYAQQPARGLRRDTTVESAPDWRSRC